MNSNYLLVNKADNVIVTLKNYINGESISVNDAEIVIKEDISTGHKIAIQQIHQGQDIIKYGFPIGHAKESIEVGQWVHTHNTQTNLKGTLDYTFSPTTEKPSKKPIKERTFKGYVRENGEIGIRNEIWIINTVGCINKTAELMAKTANEQFKEGIDGVYHYPHLFGCSQLGDDLHNTQKILSNLVHHPNAAGILVLGLGCENNHIAEFKKVIGDYDEKRVKFLSVQEAADEFDEGLELLEELVSFAKTFKREVLPISKLKVGLKCGGSDGFSGITANPLVGSFSDKLISHGGTTVLTEVPEMFGAETILMNRAQSEQVFQQNCRFSQ